MEEDKQDRRSLSRREKDKEPIMGKNETVREVQGTATSIHNLFDEEDTEEPTPSFSDILTALTKDMEAVEQRAAEEWAAKWRERTEDIDERQTYDSRFVLSSGRQVCLIRLQMSLTYAGQMEGGRVSCSYYLREGMPKRVKDEFAPHQKCIIFDDGGRALPDVKWFAEFWSGGGVKTNDSEYNSRLCICWFSDDFPADFNAFLQQTLAKINWEEDAEDYSIMW